MFRIISFGARVPAPEYLYLFRMSKNSDQVYYAVGRGRKIGIYNNWSECKAQIDGISNAKFRKFFSLAEAEEFVKFWKDYTSPNKTPVEEIPVSRFSRGGANFRRNKSSGFVQPDHKKLLALEVENTSEKRNPVGLQPYVSPIPFPLRSQFLNDVKNVGSYRSFRTPKGETLEQFSSPDNYLRTNVCTQTDLGFAVPENSSSISFCTSTSVKSVATVEASSQEANDNQSANVSSEPVIKEEVVEENEELFEVCSKLPNFLKILELALKGIARESYDESEKIRNILKEVLKKTDQTNCRINPQMESGENDKDFEESKCIEQPEVRTEEPTSSQQQNSLLSPFASVRTEEPTSSQHQNSFLSLSASVPTSPSQKPLEQKDAEVLALNLRLDSFERRFDSCLKEVGAIVSEMSHIKSDIREIKEILGQGSSGCTPKKGKDGMYQTTLNFTSPNNFESSRHDYSSRAYSTDQGGVSKEAESGEFRSNRGKRRRLSRSDSSGSTKRFLEDKDDDILSRIKTEQVEYTSFCLDENDFVEVYTDGACHYNGEREAKAGIGIWFGDSHPLNVSEPVIGAATNNVAEIQAARIAIELAVKAGVKKLKILTDSEFLINCVTKWMQRWKRNGWTLVRGGAVKNRKELEKLDRAASKISVRWEKVLAHSGIKGNEMADRLANQGAEKYVR